MSEKVFVSCFICKYSKAYIESDHAYCPRCCSIFSRPEISSETSETILLETALDIYCKEHDLPILKKTKITIYDIIEKKIPCKIITTTKTGSKIYWHKVFITGFKIEDSAFSSNIKIERSSLKNTLYFDEIKRIDAYIDLDEELKNLKTYEFLDSFIKEN